MCRQRAKAGARSSHCYILSDRCLSHSSFSIHLEPMARVCKFHQSVLHRLLLFNLLCAHLPSRGQVSLCSQKLLMGRGFLKVHKSHPSVFQCKWVLERSYSRWRDNPCSRWPSSSALWCAQGPLPDLRSYWRTLLFLKLPILRGSGQKNVRK